MKKLIPLLFCLLLAGAVHAETIIVKRGDTLSKLAKTHQTTVRDLVQQNDIENPDLILEGQALVLNENIGVDINANPLPTDNYDSFLSAVLASNTSTIFVNALPTGISSTIYTIYGSDGTTPREKVFCQGTAISPNRLTNCLRGISFSPVSGVIDETPGTGLTHSKNSRIAITDNINFSGKALAILGGIQKTSSTEFIVGTNASTTIKIIFATKSTTSTAPWCGHLGGVLVCSEDGTNTFRLRDGGSGVSAGRGIAIDASIISLLLSPTSTSGLGIDPQGRLTIATSSNNGIAANADGLRINTSTALTWSASTSFNGNAYNGVTMQNSTSTNATTTVFSAITASTTQLNANIVSSTQVIMNGKSLAPLVVASTTPANEFHYHQSQCEVKSYGYASGDTLAAGTVVTFAHTLGVAPSYIVFDAMASMPTQNSNSHGVWTSSTNFTSQFVMFMNEGQAAVDNGVQAAAIHLINSDNTVETSASVITPTNTRQFSMTLNTNVNTSPNASRRFIATLCK